MVHNESILPLLDPSEILKASPLQSVNTEVSKLQLLAERALGIASKRLKLIQVRTKSGRYSE